MLVIDYADFAYQSLFERDGYTMEKWSDVDDLPKLEAGYYDLILLDLQGVGREQSAEQGLVSYGISADRRRRNSSSPIRALIGHSNIRTFSNLRTQCCRKALTT